jgi:hypothetical protein
VGGVEKMRNVSLIGTGASRRLCRGISPGCRCVLPPVRKDHVVASSPLCEGCEHRFISTNARWRRGRGLPAAFRGTREVLRDPRPALPSVCTVVTKCSSLAAREPAEAA